jgi:hypothetical protein
VQFKKDEANLNAETQSPQRDAEKQETANFRMQKTPNVSAILCVLCVSALEVSAFGFTSDFGLRVSDFFSHARVH